MLADRIAIDYRKAGLTRRHVCMLEYAMLVSRDSESGAVVETCSVIVSCLWWH
jgi:hypothetical protein